MSLCGENIHINVYMLLQTQALKLHGTYRVFFSAALDIFHLHFFSETPHPTGHLVPSQVIELYQFCGEPRTGHDMDLA